MQEFSVLHQVGTENTNDAHRNGKHKYINKYAQHRIDRNHAAAPIVVMRPRAAEHTCLELACFELATALKIAVRIAMPGPR
jgi:hypothetical protein